MSLRTPESPINRGFPELLVAMTVNYGRVAILTNRSRFVEIRRLATNAPSRRPSDLST
uniref:Uncharacterized protein n=2 Tax=Cupriavidus taiwanensis TaxID=164546 RepID=A0A375H9V2_9BURK|nr:protein of unknown function [Cupriavidus taiwanensis]